MKTPVLLKYIFLLAVFLPAQSFAFDIYLHTTDTVRPIDAVVTITSSYKNDTVREIIYWKEIKGNFASSRARHHHYIRIDITCTGYNPIEYYRYSNQDYSFFILGKPGTKYLTQSNGLRPYIPHPNEVYIVYDPRKIKDLFRIFDRLKIPYKKNRDQVRQQFPSLNFKTHDLWLVKHSIPFKPTGSKSLEALRKADSVIYAAGPVIEIYDLGDKIFKKMMLSNFFTIDNRYTDAHKQYAEWERLGFVKGNNQGYGPLAWNAPGSMGTGLIDLLLQLNKTANLVSAVQYTDYWNESQEFRLD